MCRSDASPRPFALTLATLIALAACSDAGQTLAPQADAAVQPLVAPTELGPVLVGGIEPTFLYAFRNGDGMLRRVDIPPGSVTNVGDTGPGGASALATSAAPLLVGATEYPSGTHVGLIDNALILLDTQNGSRTVIATTKNPNGTTYGVGGRGIAFGSDGKTLYLIEDTKRKLSTVDLATGVVTTVATGLPFAASSLEWDPDTQLLYAIAAGHLYGIDEGGNVRVDRALSGLGGTPCTLARRPDDDTWYTLNNVGLWSLDISTGAATHIGVNVNLSSHCGTAFAPEHVVNEPPTGVLTDGPYKGDEGSLITMTGEGVDPEGGPVTYEWSFGDGTTGSGKVVEHAYGDEGVYTVSLIVRDQEGIGTLAPTTTATISNVDPAPTIAFTTGGAVGEEVSLTFEFADPGFLDDWLVYVDWDDEHPGSHFTWLEEPVAGEPYTATTTYDEPGTYTVLVLVDDRDGGVVGTTVTLEIVGDVTPPEISVDVVGTLGNNGWYVSDVAVDWTVTEPDSPESLVTVGCVDTQVSVDTTGETFTCEATSDGGSATADPVTIKRDVTKPSVTFSGNAGSYDIDADIAITCAVSDAMSGIASSSCDESHVPAYALGPGTYTLVGTAEDNAGNATTVSTGFTVTVSFDGTCALVERLVSHHGVANSLCAKLRAAAKAGNDNARRGPLEAFIHEVEAQSGKKIEADDAVVLVNLAEFLMP